MMGQIGLFGERLLYDLDALMALPRVPFDPCEKIATRATSISMVRYRSNDYSVPVSYAHREVQVRGYVHEVIIACGSEVIARHKRSYEKGDMVFDPIHYLPLLEQKVGAVDQAAPLKDWNLRICDPAQVAGSAHGQEGQTGIRAGSSPYGDLQHG